MKAHALGFPRMGENRELKKGLEKFWRGELDESELQWLSGDLKQRHWGIQIDHGLDLIPVGDFSLYDHMLDTVVMLGVVPERYGPQRGRDLKSYFAMARGDSESGVPAMTMTKWFDTNYHYIVPELRLPDEIAVDVESLVADIKLVRRLGGNPKPVIVGPLTFSLLGRESKGASRWEFLDGIVPAYERIIDELSRHCEWIQIDEPALCGYVPGQGFARVAEIHARLHNTAAANGSKTMVATYFGPFGENLELAMSLPCDALHVDLVRAPEQLDEVLDKFPDDCSLSLGLVDGRNVWKTNYDLAVELIYKAEKALGRERLMVAGSCSFLHSPMNLDGEGSIPVAVRNWMAFAVQKCAELAALRDIATGENCSGILHANRAARESRRRHPNVQVQQVRERVKAITPEMACRKSGGEQRRKTQRELLGLPIFPTTTIGSFPQTGEIRKVRLAWRRGEISSEAYGEAMRAEIAQCIARQEEIGLDVLVHGEPERNDMVEYFGQQMEGFCFSENGWVQSYGSRCVKPPIIYGDVSRPAPMTVDWIRFAMGCTEKPVKGMLTGPVTILCWSFVRDDLPRDQVCRQLALAVRDEVRDLEDTGVGIIQIDEAAFREGLPLLERDRKEYLDWAVDCFRIASSGVRDQTQIHTHMCYSEFNSIMPFIARMDADVISIEASRSGMTLLDVFGEFDYPADIGPGVYDIHSPRVPSQGEIISLLKKALEYISPDSLWVNPDCGLKTRAWPESEKSLANLVAAASFLRKEHESDMR